MELYTSIGPFPGTDRKSQPASLIRWKGIATYFQFYAKTGNFPKKSPYLSNKPDFSPKVLEIPNLKTNSPKAGTLNL